jgi:Xaa-Pro aminopeptidase
MIQTPVPHYQSRVARIREALQKKRLDGFLVTDMHNVRYLTGFTGSSGFALITKKECILLTDFRYKEQSEKETQGWDIVIEKDGRIDLFRDLCKKTGIKKLGFESSVSYEFYTQLLYKRVRLISGARLIERIRETKDDVEIQSIKEAVRRAEAAFLDIRPHIRHGISERAIALRLEERLKKNGCMQIPFAIIVASGSNSAMPHAQPTERKLQKGDLVIIDWGGEANGYFSDMTRTLLMRGTHVDRQKEIYKLVLKSNREAISSVVPGAKTRDIDAAARNIIKKAGYGELFGHGTGHGIGLQVHEAPRLSWMKNDVVRINMVFTVEPGIYVPGLGGVRIEDMVVVGEKKTHVLTSLPKKLEII